MAINLIDKIFKIMCQNGIKKRKFGVAMGIF